MNLLLKRIVFSENGTFGELWNVTQDAEEFLCYTLEPPWNNNQENISCIPAGEYTVKPHNSPKFGDVFQVMNVPGRTDVLIHKGNVVTDTHGCILVGTAKGELGRMIYHSATALQLLKSRFKEFQLVVKNPQT